MFMASVMLSENLNFSYKNFSPSYAYNKPNRYRLQIRRWPEWLAQLSELNPTWFHTKVKKLNHLRCTQNLTWNLQGKYPSANMRDTSRIQQWKHFLIVSHRILTSYDLSQHLQVDLSLSLLINMFSRNLISPSSVYIVDFISKISLYI